MSISPYVDLYENTIYATFGYLAPEQVYEHEIALTIDRIANTVVRRLHSCDGGSGVVPFGDGQLGVSNVYLMFSCYKEGVDYGDFDPCSLPFSLKRLGKPEWHYKVDLFMHDPSCSR